MKKLTSNYPSPVATRYQRCLAKTMCLAVFAISLVPISRAQRENPEPILDTPTRLSAIQSDLQKGMADIADNFKAPMFIVLKGDHATLNIQGGQTTLRQALDSALHQNPGYRWEIRDGIVYFHEAELQSDPMNFLSWKLKTFNIFSDVAVVRQSLGAHIQSVRYRATSKGGAITGVKETELTNHLVPTTTMTDTTPVDIMLKTLAIDRHFYSIIQFPGPGPLKDSDLDAAFISWRWVPFVTSAEP